MKSLTEKENAACILMGLRTGLFLSPQQWRAIEAAEHASTHPLQVNNNVEAATGNAFTKVQDRCAWSACSSPFFNEDEEDGQARPEGVVLKGREETRASREPRGTPEQGAVHTQESCLHRDMEAPKHERGQFQRRSSPRKRCPAKRRPSPRPGRRQPKRRSRLRPKSRTSIKTSNIERQSTMPLIHIRGRSSIPDLNDDFTVTLLGQKTETCARPGSPCLQDADGRPYKLITQGQPRPSVPGIFVRLNAHNP